MDNARLTRIGILLLRYGVALGLVVVLGIVYAVTLYIELLILAAVTHTGIGGPLALPFMMLVAAVFSLVYGLAVAIPVCLVTEWLLKGRRLGPWGFLLPAIALAGLLVTGYVAGALSAASLVSPPGAGSYESSALAMWALVTLLAPLLALWTMGYASRWLLQRFVRKRPRAAPYVLWGFHWP